MFLLTRMQNYFDSLPQELLTQIIYYLNEEDINKLFRSSNTLKELYFNEDFWKNCLYQNCKDILLTDSLWITNYFNNINIKKKYDINIVNEDTFYDYMVFFTIDPITIRNRIFKEKSAHIYPDLIVINSLEDLESNEEIIINKNANKKNIDAINNVIKEIFNNELENVNYLIFNSYNTTKNEIIHNIHIFDISIYADYESCDISLLINYFRVLLVNCPIPIL